jgi:hypothetical protein
MSAEQGFPRRLAQTLVSGAIVLGLASVPGGRVAAQSAPDYQTGRIGSTLGTTEQVVKDALAARIFATPQVQQAVRDLEEVYRKDPAAALPDAEKTLARAAQATAMAQSAAVVAKDPDRPSAHWAVTAPHHWGDVQVPLSGAMIDNPDNIYRSIPIDGAAKYEIRGRVVSPGPAQETFVLHAERSGATKDQKVKTQEDESGSVSLENLKLGPDGSFTITVDNSPANGRLNHIQSQPEVRDGYILVRDTLADWSRENPVKLEVRRLSGPPVRPPPTEAQLAERAAALTATTGPYWLAWAHKVMLDRPVNTFTHEVSRVTGWGFIKCGWYNLKDDEALVIRLDRRQAAYLGFQLSDVWGQGQAPEYIEKTGSLNGSQALPNADGTYTYVIAVADPAVHNWLDPSGLHAGTFCARWQKLPAGVSAADAVKSMQVAPIQDLKRTLPAETKWVTPEQRAAQYRARTADFARRLNR